MDSQTRKASDDQSRKALGNQRRKAMATTPLSAKVLSVVALAGPAPVALNMAQRTRQGAPKNGPPFFDPTGTVSANVRLGHPGCVGPFAAIKGGSRPSR